MQILLIEDNQGDVQILDIVLSELLSSHKLNVISNSPKAVEYINSISNPGAELPDFIIIDYKLPKSTGLNILKQIKVHPLLNKCPVFIFTATEDDQLKSMAISMGAEDYLVKPLLLNDYIEAVKRMINLTNKSLQTEDN